MNNKKVKKQLKEFWYVIPLILIIILGFYIRMQPAASLENCVDGVVCLLNLDPFYHYRMAETTMNNDFHLPDNDTMRYYPYGWDPHSEFPMMLYTPGIFYKVLNTIIPMTYYQAMLYFPALFGGLFALAMFFLGKELYGKKAGLLAAFFIAVTPGTLHRTSASVVEKEPIGGLFMLLALYFFVRAIKKDSKISAINAGLSLTVMNMVWGGATFLFLLIPAFTLIIYFLNKQEKSLYRTYVFTTLIPLIIPTLFSTTSAVKLFDNYGLITLTVFIIITIRHFSEKMNLIKPENLKYVVPVTIIVLFLIGLFLSLFSQTIARLFLTISSLVHFSHGTVGSTVAENNPTNWNGVTGQLSALYAGNLYPSLAPILKYTSLWIFTIFGFLYSSYEIIKKKKWIYLLPIIWLASSYLGALRSVRLIFLVGFPAALLGGYFISKIIDILMNLEIMKNAKSIEEKINVYSIVSAIAIFLILFSNLASGLAVMKSSGPGLNTNWQNAMKFLKTDTPTDSVIMSWWDYGYWFQTAGERTSMGDGGNQMGGMNEMLGQAFTYTNISQLEDTIKNNSVDYVVVDYTLIGKYAAMSKIANDAKFVDSFIPLGQPVNQLKQGNKTILVFAIGSNAFYIPIGTDGELSGNIVFSTANGDVNLKYLCTAQGLLDLGAPEPTFDACIVLSKFGIYMPYPNKEAGISNFAKLYLFDGAGIPFLEKVYDNTEIKIFKVDFNRGFGELSITPTENIESLEVSSS
ncbi:MAG: glycosyltransferase family 39 protein [DPANN group archaeon]|nr:glycosyltransferase family 39 protein [DPANN group archaeon]